MVKFVSVKGNELCCIKGEKGFGERWADGKYLESSTIKSVTHDYLTKTITYVWSDYTVSVLPVNLIVAIQDLDTGEWYYRT